MSSNTVTVTVTNGQSQPVNVSLNSPPEILREARKRLSEMTARDQALQNEAQQKSQREAELRLYQQHREETRLETERMALRMEAEKVVLARQAQKIIEEKEAQINAEMERLKLRTPLEVLQDEVASLRDELAGVRSLIAPTARY
jgi:exonuclease VII large subunit